MEVEPIPPIQVTVDRIYKTLRPEGIGSTDIDQLIEQDLDELVGDTKITELEIDGFKEQDRFLPMENVSRIMKTCLPPKTKVSKDAKETVQECTSEFISFITAEAADFCASEKRKTITGEDILSAMVNLGFENYSEALKIYLTKYRQHQSAIGKRSKKVKLSSVAEQTLVATGEAEEEEEEEEEEEDDDEEDVEEEAEDPVSDEP